MSPVLLALLLGCPSEPAAPPEPARSRVDAVAAAPKKEVSPAEFCESRPKDKHFAFPEMDEPAPPAPTGWTWVNVWATWCKPCVAEMPMLVKWQARLAAEGLDVALRFLSVDAKADDVAAFLKANPEVPRSPRLKDIKLLAEWLPTIGLDASAVLPIHLFVAPDQSISCVRMGSVGDADYDAIKQVVAGK